MSSSSNSWLSCWGCCRFFCWFELSWAFLVKRRRMHLCYISIYSGCLRWSPIPLSAILHLVPVEINALIWRYRTWSCCPADLWYYPLWRGLAAVWFNELREQFDQLGHMVHKETLQRWRVTLYNSRVTGYEWKTWFLTLTKKSRWCTFLWLHLSNSTASD